MQLQVLSRFPLLVLALLAWTQSATAAPEESSLKAQTVEGKRLYREHCEICHGMNMNSTTASTFDLRTLRPEEKERFVASVSNGKNNMPPWRSVLSKADIEALFAFVTSSRRE